MHSQADGSALPSTTFRVFDLKTPPASFRDDVISGLSSPQKWISPKYLYDKRGSELFDTITDLPEYYPTRTELAIMRESVDEMVACIGSEAILIEYGSGSSLKTRLLLERLQSPLGYAPIDISEGHLLETAEKLAAEFSHIPLFPIVGDYGVGAPMPSFGPPGAHRVAYFPGSTIGNFNPGDAVAFLKQVAQVVGEGGGFLIGVDLKKDKGVLRAAYNDAAGVTAAFNLNLLRRINRELAGTFDLDQFEHYAPYNEEEGRIEMHLRSLVDQKASVCGVDFSFAAGETIHTENSYKFDLAQFAVLAGKAGFEQRHVWMDPNQFFSVQFLVVKS